MNKPIKTRNGKELNLIKLDWFEATYLIKTLNPTLCDMMKSVKSPDEDFIFYKATYSFGDKIFGQNKCFIALNDGTSLSFSDENIPDELRDDLSFNPVSENPLGIILSGTNELYDVVNNKLYSRNILKPGHIFGIPKALDSENKNRTSIINSQMNAGARSLFMLQKISDKFYYHQINQTNHTQIPCPENIDDHWDTFKCIAKEFKSDWQCEIIYFSRNFISKLKTLEWSSLAFYLSKAHAKHYDAWHGMSHLWHHQLDVISQNNQLTKYNHSLINILKYIIMLITNSKVGSAPFDDDSMCPSNLLKEFYKNNYGIKYPTIMGPTRFYPHDPKCKPAYLSLSYHKFIVDNIITSGKKTNIAALSDIIFLMGTLNNSALLHKNNLTDILNSINVSYYHNAHSNNSYIKSAKQIIETDTRFINSKNDFPASSTFFNGCIQISHKK